MSAFQTKDQIFLSSTEFSIFRVNVELAVFRNISFQKFLFAIH